jgi:SnoaL-like domain
MVSDQEFSTLEGRVRELEDKLAIYQLIASYGPSIDGGAVVEAGRLWTDDAWYDSDAPTAGSDGVHGRAGIEAVAKMCGEMSVGVAHITHLPIVNVDGDRATVVGHSNTFHQDEGEFHVARVASNRWDLERIDGAWRVRRRTNRLLDGSAESKAVLAEGLRDAQEADRIR